MGGFAEDGLAVTPVPRQNLDMRDPQIIETELMEMSAIADESIKLERIIAWCASHPDEVPFALHQLLNRRDKHAPKSSEA